MLPLLNVNEHCIIFLTFSYVATEVIRNLCKFVKYMGHIHLHISGTMFLSSFVHFHSLYSSPSLSNLVILVSYYFSLLSWAKNHSPAQTKSIVSTFLIHLVMIRWLPNCKYFMCFSGFVL